MIQRSFSSGEVDPALYGRADVDRWKSALKLCKNWVVQPEGGIVVRQGFELKARVPYTDADKTAIIGYEFGPSDSHVQVYHDGSMSIMSNGSLLYGDTIQSVTVNRAVTPWSVTYAGKNYADGSTITGSHGYLTGDTVTFYDGTLKGLTKVITKTSDSAYTLNGTTATSGSETAHVRRTTIAVGSAPMVSYFIGDYGFETARYVQSGDVQYFTNGTYSPLSATRDYWAGVDRGLSFTFANILGHPPFNSSITLGVTASAGTDQLRYQVTYTDATEQESAVMRQSASSSAITGTTTLTITDVAHGLITNDTIQVTEQLLDDYGNVLYKPGDLVRVVVTTVDAFTIPGQGFTASTRTLQYAKISASVIGLFPTSAAPATLTWTAVSGAVTYNVYKEFGRVYGYIGSTSSTTFVDKGIVPDVKDTPVIGVSPFRGTTFSAGDSPTAVGLFQQRLMFGGFTTDIERITGSYIGDYTSYDPGAADASGLDFTLAGRTVSGIQHLLETAGRAVVLSNTAEWVLKGATGGGLTPTAINARADSYYGCSSVAPALVGTSLIYVQRGDRIVREARYDFAQEALASADLTLWSKHLFRPEIKRLAYQRTAQILWALRKDGVLLGMTYVPEQNVWGWHQHEVAGRTISDICVVSEDGSDRLYCAILDDTHINVCRLPLAWEPSDVDDHLGFDMGLFYDGRLSQTGTLTGGTLWTTAETLTLTASGSVFVVGDVGKDFLLRLGEESVYVTCTAYTSGTVVSVTPRTLVPTTLRGVASTTFARCASTFSGLGHLEGDTVGIIADGNVEVTAIVASGAVTTASAYARVQVGIPITATAQTLDLEPDDKDTYLGDFKHVTRVFLRVKDSRGVTVGIDEDHLNEPPLGYTDVVNGVPPLQSGPVEILMDAAHEASGSVVIRQDTGLPAAILNARPVFNVGELK
jgi:hypothetical protein